MRLEDYLDIALDTGSYQLRGHAIRLEQIAKRYQLGYSAERIQQDFPDVSLEQLYAAITFYLHHQAEIDAYIASLERDGPILADADMTSAEHMTAVFREHAHEWETA